MKVRKHIECKKKKSCIYGKRFTGVGLYCDYLGMTGSMRPCPADNCTVYKRKKKNKQSIGGID